MECVVVSLTHKLMQMMDDMNPNPMDPGVAPEPSADPMPETETPAEPMPAGEPGAAPEGAPEETPVEEPAI